MMRFWIGVASRDHVKVGESGGFCQLGHGKEAPVRRLSPGDWLIYYSPKAQMKTGDRIQSFTAIGEIRAGEVYRAQQTDCFRPFRRDVAYAAAQDAQIEPLLGELEFASGRANWGLLVRRGLFEISRADFRLIASAMKASPSPEAE